jgi:uncharacterized protein
MLPAIAKSLCLSSFALCLSIPDARAGEAALKDSVPHVTVMGSANMEVVPTIAILSLGVVTERPVAADAVDENARTAQALIDDIKAQGIEGRDIKTISATFSPVYDTESDPVSHTTSQKLSGYRARNILEVRFRDFSKAGKLASQWAGKGANEILNLHFDVENVDAIYERLRGEAMQNALRRARAYIPMIIGQKLGRVIEIAADDIPEEAKPVLNMQEFRGESAVPAPVAIPIEPGTQNLHTSVRVTWELLQQ